MTELLTSQQMRDLEQTDISSGFVAGLTLMERAGQGVVDAVIAQWSEFGDGSHEAVVLAGPGNNGGDGFVIARLLRAMGWQVRVHLFGDPARLPPDAKAQHELWTKTETVHPFEPDAIFVGSRPNLFVDAVFGIGLTRPVPDVVAQALDRAAMKRWPRGDRTRRVAVDCPSGLNLDTGMIVTDMEKVAAQQSAWPQTLNTADLTVTFHAPKVGHYIGMGPALCGTLAVVDIGLSPDAAERAMIGTPPDRERARLVAPEYAGRSLPHRMWLKTVMGRGNLNGHKYDYGHVAVMAGGVGRGGAARMAARAALRAGAGLVTVICPPSALIENACQLNAIMLRSWKSDQPLVEVADARVSAFCLGPGLGVSERTCQMVEQVLARRAERNALRDPAVVLDADALSSFADNPERLFAQTHARTILTPHDGEFARLFPDLTGPARITLPKVDAVRQAAARAGCIVLLKGPDTVIADPSGGASVHAAAYGREAPWLATAGAGDVLAGLIAGLAAPWSSAEAFCVAELAAYLHVDAARRFGPGLIAEDLPEQLPHLFREYGL